MGLFFHPDSGRLQVWSCGGGTQSTALAVLILTGALPKPDIAVMVDTERENSDTFEYFNKYTGPALANIGLAVDVVKKSQYATCDLTSKNGKHILIPAFTNREGTVGKMDNFCSGEWKRAAIDRHLRRFRKVKACDLWMGMSLDEMSRVADSRKKWARNVYPLIELRMRRQSCVRVVTEFGWPKPPRSSCWMCPNKHWVEWQDMKDNRPSDFGLACDFQRELLKTDPNAWLHPACKPLEEIDFKAEGAPNACGGLFEDDGCKSGMCFV